MESRTHFTSLQLIRRKRNLAFAEHTIPLGDSHPRNDIRISACKFCTASHGNGKSGFAAMRWVHCEIVAIAAERLVAPQGFVGRNGGQPLDWDEDNVLEKVGKGAGIAPISAEDGLSYAVADLQLVDYEEAAKESFGKTIEGLQDLKRDSLPEALRRYIEEHPYLTAVQIAALLLVVCPGVLSTPALAAVGFSEVGPMAGEHEQSFPFDFILADQFDRLLRGMVPVCLWGELCVQRPPEREDGWLWHCSGQWCDPGFRDRRLNRR